MTVRRGMFLVVALLLLPILVTRLAANVGMQLVNRGLESASDVQLRQAQTILEQIPDDVSSQRGRADIAIVQQDLALAAALWQASGEAQRLVSRGDAIQFVGDEAADSVHNAMNWYAQAVEAGQDSAELWLGIGRLCRMNPARDALCAQYVARQNGNLLLNPSFAHGLDGWTVQQPAGATIAVVECASDRCAQIISSAETPDFAATVSQCVAVEAGRIYQFSAEIALENYEPAEIWLPLYAQAFVGGAVRELRSEIAIPKTAGFHALATEFVMPQTDDGLICVHLARAAGSAEIIVKNPVLVSVADVENRAPRHTLDALFIFIVR